MGFARIVKDKQRGYAVTKHRFQWINRGILKLH
jgi:hypothetical protein